MVRGQRSREKILEAAASLFHRRGFQPTSLEDVLEASGVCRSNFYYHFRSKEDLGLAVLARQAGRFDADVIEGILENERESPRSRLSRPFGNLAAELGGSHPEFRSRLGAFFRRWEDAVERCLREGVAAGEFRRDLDTRRIAMALVSQIEGAVLLTKTHGGGEPIDAAAHAMLTLLESR